MITIELAIPAFIIGVLFLWKGSDILVDGTKKIAFMLGVSTLVVSVILVGFGTSAPEFAISVGAAIQKNSEISLGNIIGSCIANILLVLGIASIIKPIDIKGGIVKREYPLMLGATFVLFLSSYIGLLDDYHYLGGVIFLILFILFLYFFYKCAKKERIKNENLSDKKLPKNLFFVFLGIIGVVVGAWLLIESAVSIATFLEVPTFMIAISIVAVGTSVPELVVSSMAAYKGESDIAVGNVLGSNVFNILMILGVAALFIPLYANTSESIAHLSILLIITLIMYPIINSRKIISRIEGVFMLALYFVYMWFTFFGYELIL
jgi:cation:H+ antiporter